MKAMNERLVEDNRRYDAKIRKASSIIDSIFSENKRLKNMLDKRDDVIEELKRQNREMEESLLKTKGDILNYKKHKSIEARLRKEIEDLINDKVDLELHIKEIEDCQISKLEDMKQELRHQVLLKEKIISDVSKIADKGSQNEDLIEEYVQELREAENENTKIKKELFLLKEDRNYLIESHTREITEIQEKAQKAMKRFKEASAGISISTRAPTGLGGED